MHRVIAELEGVLTRAAASLVEGATHALAHVGRWLGQPEAVPVGAVMLSRVATVSAEQSLEDAAQLLVATRSTHLPVVDGASVLGVVTREDVATAVARSGPRARVATAPRHDAIRVAPSDSIADVMARLRAVPGSVAVVEDRGMPVGLLTLERLLAYSEHVPSGHASALSDGHTSEHEPSDRAPRVNVERGPSRHRSPSRSTP
jgi:CBS domain-containing protein